MLRLLYQLGVILQNNLKILEEIIIHEYDSQFVVNLDYQLVMKKLGLMITKTLIIRCYTIKCDLSLYTLQHNIMHFIIALTHNTLSQSNFKRIS